MKNLVIIEEVTQYTVIQNNGLLASKEMFPGAKKGQTWEVETESEETFNGRLIVSAKLVKDV